MRLTCFATNTKNIPIAQLELRHLARAEDRIRAKWATGSRSYPSPGRTEPIWLKIIQIALDLRAWMPSSPSPIPPGAGRPKG